MTENKEKLKKCVKCQIPETYETIEFDKKGSPSAICEVISEDDSAQLNITWFTGTGKTLKKVSADSFQLTDDKILD